MPAYRILIVEDQSDVRNMLRSGLETLGPEFEVVATPSGEEAFLELTRHQFALLIADVRLAGMSGIDLKAKALSINPDIKVILITGVSDPIFRRHVADAGADAFFFKPIVMASLFKTVEELLELDKTDRQVENEEPSPASLPSNPEIVERLASLQDALKAVSAILFHTNGNVIARVGAPLDAAIISDLVPMILQLLNTGNKITQLFGKQTPQDLYCISGNKFNFSMTHVNMDHSLLVVTITDPGVENLGTIGLSIHTAAQDLSLLLTQVAQVPEPKIAGDETVLAETITDNERQEPLPDTDLSKTPFDDQPQEALPDVDDIFHAQDREDLSPDDIDAFWDWPTVDGDSDSFDSTSDSLSYNEARELGITPDGDEH